MKKVLTFLGIALIIGAGFGFSYQGSNSQMGKKGLLKQNQKSSFFGYGFMDENGDGISDRYRDFDGDGVPNCQDPDWNRPANGKGYQNGERGNQNMQKQGLKQNGGQGNQNWNKNQFRNNQNHPLGNKAGQKNGKGSSNRHGKK